MLRPSRQLPATALILLLVMLNLPIWAVIFLPRPWTLYASGETFQAVATALAYYVLPLGLVGAILTRSFYFIGMFVLECLAIVGHGAATAAAMPLTLQLVRGGLALVVVISFLLLANRDFLFPFFAHGQRRWRRAPRLYANVRAKLRRGEDPAVSCVVDDLSLFGLGVTLDASKGGEAWARGDRVHVVIGHGDKQVDVGGEIVWSRDDAHTRRFGVLTADSPRMELAIQRFTGRGSARPLEAAMARIWVSTAMRRAALAVWGLSLGGALSVPACGTAEMAKKDIRVETASTGLPAIEGPVTTAAVAAATGDEKGASTVAAATDDQGALETLRNDMIKGDDYLAALIAKNQREASADLEAEIAERKASDEALNTALVALSARVDLMAGGLVDALASVKRASDQLAGPVAQRTAQLTADLAALDAKVDQTTEAAMQALKAQIDGQKTDLLKGLAALGDLDQARATALAGQLADLADAARQGDLDKAKALSDAIIGVRADLAGLAAKDLVLAQAMKDGDAAARAAAVLGVQQVRDELYAQNARSTAVLLVALADAEVRLRAAGRADANAVMEALRKEQATATAELRAELEAYKQLANATFATKSFVDGALRASAATLVATIDFLGRRIDTSKQEVLAVVDQKILASATEWRTRLEKVGNDISVLTQAVETYSAQLTTLDARVTSGFTDASGALATLTGTVGQNRADADAALAELQKRVATQEAFAQTMGPDLAKAVMRLDALDPAVAQLQKDFADAQALEKESRAAQAAKLTELSDGVTAAMDTAKAGLELAKAVDVRVTNLEAVAKAMDLRLNGVASDLSGLQAALTAQDGELQNQIEGVRALATSIGVKLGDAKNDIANTAAKVADLTLKVASLSGPLGLPLSYAITNADDLGAALKALAAPLDAAAKSTLALTRAAGTLEGAVIDAFDPILKTGIIDTDRANATFEATVKAACGGTFTKLGTANAVGGREWFVLVANAYVQQILTVQATGLASLLARAALPSLTAAQPLACQQAVASFALSTLASANAANVDAVRAAQDVFTTSLKDLAAAANRIDAVVLPALKGYLLTPALLNNFLNVAAGDGAGFYTQLARLTAASAGDAEALAILRGDLARMTGIALKVEGEEKAIAAHQALIDALDGKIGALAKTVDARVSALTGSVAQLFRIVATMATRLNYADLAATALGGANSLGGTGGPIAGVTPTVFSVAHRYLHFNAGVVGECTSLTATAAQPLTLLNASACAVHVDGGGAPHPLAHTWGNGVDLLVANGWDAQGKAAAGGNTVNNGLWLKPYDPNKDMARVKDLMARSAGGRPAADGESILIFRVIGRADYFQLNATSAASPTFYPETVTVKASDFLVNAGDGYNLVYDIPFPYAVGPLGNCTWNRNVEVVALDAKQKPAGDKVVHMIHTFSPLALDFSGDEQLATTNPLRRPVRFDLDADGTADESGWLAPGPRGLLALDKNGNGRIDDGNELFGEATGKDGYQALAAYDADHDGFISEKDPVFEKLTVWFDTNANGFTDPFELRSLRSLGVTRIAVTGEPQLAGQVIQSEGLPEGNLVKLRSRFFGPKRCGTAGCPSYDVYFGSASSRRLSVK